MNSDFSSTLLTVVRLTCDGIDYTSLSTTEIYLQFLVQPLQLKKVELPIPKASID